MNKPQEKPHSINTITEEEIPPLQPKTFSEWLATGPTLSVTIATLVFVLPLIISVGTGSWTLAIFLSKLLRKEIGF